MPDQLTKSGGDRRGAYDLAARPALVGGQFPALECQAASLLGTEVDSRPAGCRRKRLFEKPDLLFSDAPSVAITR
jgi:hypothetical protein